MDDKMLGSLLDQKLLFCHHKFITLRTAILVIPLQHLHLEKILHGIKHTVTSVDLQRKIKILLLNLRFVLATLACDLTVHHQGESLIDYLRVGLSFRMADFVKK